MQHFNGLTPAEAERLALLMEEMAEAQQVIGKILRHGYESYNPLDSSHKTNRYLLTKELGHVRHAIIRICDSGDIDRANLNTEMQKKSESIERWLHHQQG